MKDKFKTKAQLIDELALARSRIDQLESMKTEHKLALDYLENVLENSPDAIGIVDKSGRFIKWSRMAEKLFGYSFQELSGKRAFELYADPGSLERMLDKLRTEGSIKHFEIDVKRKDGTIIPFEVSITLLMDSENKLTGSVGVARDLSDLKKALNAQERSNAQLQEEIADRQRIEEALRDSEEQLRLLSYRILSAQEEERKRIAVELHDSIGSSLGAVKYSMENILNQIQQGMPAHESIQYSIGVIRHAIEEVRRMHTDLRPSILDDLGIIATIDWFCRLFRTIHPNMLVEKEIGTKENEVPETLKIVIFRIIQESFHNIAKYSKARCVGVSLTQIGGVIELIVKDNGVGFDLTSVQSCGHDCKGLGLISMKERTELSSGSFEIQTVVGEGTRVRASWKSARPRYNSS